MQKTIFCLFGMVFFCIASARQPALLPVRYAGAFPALELQEESEVFLRLAWLLEEEGVEGKESWLTWEDLAQFGGWDSFVLQAKEHALDEFAKWEPELGYGEQELLERVEYVGVCPSVLLVVLDEVFLRWRQELGEELVVVLGKDSLGVFPAWSPRVNEYLTQWDYAENWQHCCFYVNEEGVFFTEL